MSPLTTEPLVELLVLARVVRGGLLREIEDGTGLGPSDHEVASEEFRLVALLARLDRVLVRLLQCQHSCRGEGPAQLELFP